MAKIFAEDFRLIFTSLGDKKSWLRFGRGASVPFGALAEAAGVGRCKVALVVCLGVVWRGAAAAPALLGHVALLSRDHVCERLYFSNYKNRIQI